MLQRGEILKNQYIVKLILHEGRNSVIYSIEDTETAEEWILKEFSAGTSNPQQIGIATLNFEKDLIVLAGLNHPGIPKFIDFFTIIDKQYIVMEYIRGRNLERSLTELRNPMYEPDAVKLGIQLADIIGFLHSQNPPILLRDLRPGHILITPDKQVKLIDFNLVRHFKGMKDDLKKTGIPGYMPPEQFGKDIIDERSDIYALGAILHHLVTLRNPTEIPNAFRFPKPSKINPKVSTKLDEIIEKATSNDPDARYSSVLQLKHELENLEKKWNTPTPAIKRNAPKVIPDKKRPAPKTETVEIEMAQETKPAKSKTQPQPAAGPSKNLLIITAVLTVILGILGLLQVLGLGKNHRTYENVITSTDLLIKDNRIKEIRSDAIKAYEEGTRTGDLGKLSTAATLFTRVITAYPSDVLSQVYLENCFVYMKEKEFLRVAAIVSLFGEEYDSGSQILSGILIAQSLHNRSKDGIPIVVEVFDEESSTEKAMQLAVRLSKRKDLLAVIGPLRSPRLQNTATILSRSEIVQMSPTGVCADIEDLGDFVFRTAGDGRNLSIYMANLAVNDMKLHRLAVVFDPTAGYSKIMGEIFVDTIRNSPGVDYREYTVDLEAKSYDKVTREIKKFDPDAIFFVGYQEHQVRIAKSIKSAGLRALHLGTVASYTPTLLQAGGKAVEGMIMNTYFLPDDATGEGLRFVNLYKQKFGGLDPNYRCSLAFDSMLVIAEATNHGHKTSVELQKFLKQDLGTKVKVTGSTGDISFDRFGRRNSITLFPIVVRNGDFVVYKPGKK